MTPDLSALSDQELISELKSRDYRVVHRDRIRTAAAQVSWPKHHLAAMRDKRERQEYYIRQDLGNQLGHFLGDHLQVEELPDETHIDFRMTVTIIGPKLSHDDLDYFVRWPAKTMS